MINKEVKFSCSTIASIRAWSNLLWLISTLEKAGCECITVSSLKELMIVLISNDYKSNRVKQGLSVLNEVVGSGVVAYYNNAGRFVGFEGLKGVNTGNSKIESTSKTTKTLYGGVNDEQN